MTSTHCNASSTCDNFQRKLLKWRQKAGEGDNNRIVGGLEASVNQFPYQVSMQYYGEHVCGGTVIDPDHVLTAAHCCFGPQSAISVVAGVKYLNDEGQRRAVNRVTLHELYRDDRVEYDICLLRLNGAFQLDNVTVAAVDMAREVTQNGEECVVAGWGSTRSGGGSVNTLKYVELPNLGDSECDQAYTSYDPESMMCAGCEAGGRDSCQGDSGGGLICRDQLAGIVSFGHGCALPGYPGVYTEVYYYRDWIKENGSARAKPLVAISMLSLMISTVYY